jgi:hypothetical protein
LPQMFAGPAPTYSIQYQDFYGLAWPELRPHLSKNDRFPVGCGNFTARRVGIRVARFSSVHDTKTEKNAPNDNKMYQLVMKYPPMSIKFSKWPSNIKTLSHLRPTKI